MTRADGGPRVAAVILAAGESARMRGISIPKQLLPVAGRPLLQHAVDAALASSVDETILALGHEAARIRNELVLPVTGKLRVVEVADHATGQSAALRAGVAACGTEVEVAAVLLGDQPGVGPRRIDAVLEAFRGSPQTLARPFYRDDEGEEIPGHPVVIGRAHWSALASLRGDVGLREILAELTDALLRVPMPGPAPRDVDTPEDYRRLVDAARALG